MDAVARTELSKDFWENLEPSEQQGVLGLMGGQLLANIDAEQALLGAILVNNSAMPYLGQLKPEHFHEAIHQRIFSAIGEVYAQGKTANPITLRHYFDQDGALAEIGGGEYLARLAAAAVTVINVTDFADIIHDLHTRRSMAALLLRHLRLLGESAKPGESASTVQMRMIDDLTAIDTGLTKRRTRSWREVSKLLVDDLKSVIAPDSTGIGEMDESLLGGFHPRRSYCIQARMKVGKTGLMLTAYGNVVEGYQRRWQEDYAAWAVTQAAPTPQSPHAPRRRHALYICAEMGERESHQRTLGRILGYNSTAFYNRRDDMDFLYQVQNFQETASDLPGLYYDAPGITFGEFKHVLTTTARRHSLGGFFFDHLGLIRADSAHRREYSSKVDFYEDVCAWIAQFCKEYVVWGVYASQTNRQGETRGSDAPDMFADAVMQLETDEDRMVDGKKTTVAWVKMKAIRYHRRRDIGTREAPRLMLNWNGPHFCEIPQDACIEKAAVYSALEN